MGTSRIIPPPPKGFTELLPPPPAGFTQLVVGDSSIDTTGKTLPDVMPMLQPSPASQEDIDAAGKRGAYYDKVAAYKDLYSKQSAAAQSAGVILKYLGNPFNVQGALDKDGNAQTEAYDQFEEENKDNPLIFWSSAVGKNLKFIEEYYLIGGKAKSLLKGTGLANAAKTAGRFGAIPLLQYPTEQEKQADLYDTSTSRLKDAAIQALFSVPLTTIGGIKTTGLLEEAGKVAAQSDVFAAVTKFVYNGSPSDTFASILIPIVLGAPSLIKAAGKAIPDFTLNKAVKNVRENATKYGVDLSNVPNESLKLVIKSVKNAEAVDAKFKAGTIDEVTRNKAVVKEFKDVKPIIEAIYRETGSYKETEAAAASEPAKPVDIKAITAGGDVTATETTPAVVTPPVTIQVSSPSSSVIGAGTTQPAPIVSSVATKPVGQAIEPATQEAGEPAPVVSSIQRMLAKNDSLRRAINPTRSELEEDIGQLDLEREELQRRIENNPNDEAAKMELEKNIEDTRLSNIAIDENQLWEQAKTIHPSAQTFKLSKGETPLTPEEYRQLIDLGNKPADILTEQPSTLRQLLPKPAEGQPPVSDNIAAVAGDVEPSAAIVLSRQISAGSISEPPEPPKSTTVSPNSRSRATRFFDSALKGPRFIGTKIFTRLKHINNGVAYDLRGMQFNRDMDILQAETELKGWTDGASRMSKEDASQWNIDAGNKDWAHAFSLLQKYGIEDEFKKWSNVSKAIADEYTRTTGRKIKRDDLYYHLRVKNVAGLREYLESGSSNAINQAIANIERLKKEPLTVTEREAVINTLMRGYKAGGVSIPIPGSAMRRVIKDYDKDIISFYSHPSAAATDYVRSMYDSIYRAKFFGRESAYIDRQRAKLERLYKRLSKLDASDDPNAKKSLRLMKEAKVTSDMIGKYDESIPEESIGSRIDELIQGGAISSRDLVQVKNMINAYFNPKGMSPATSTYIQLCRMEALSGFSSFLTQMQGEAINVYEGGLYNYLKTISKRLTGSGYELRLEDLGKLSHRITEAYESGPVAKVEDALYRINLLSTGDLSNKLRLINPVWYKFVSQAKKNSPKLRQYLNEVYDNKQERVEAAMKSLAAGDKTRDSLFPIYCKLLDIHPIAPSELPEGYLTGGNMRGLYFLNTYNLSQFDYLKEKIYTAAKKPETRGEAFKALLYLIPGLLAGSFIKQDIRDRIRGKQVNEFDFTKFGDINTTTGLDMLTEGLLTLLPGVNRYAAIRFIRGDIGNPVAMPTPKMLEYLMRDVRAGKMKHLKRDIPLFGDWYYYRTENKQDTGGRKGRVSREERKERKSR